jgi:UDP-N-acetyl-D-galactosamine dehydrogenase
MNDGMGSYVAKEVVKYMIRKEIKLKDAKVLLLGITFKENCPDVRNTKIVDVVAALQDYGLVVDIYDPWASATEVQREYGLQLKDKPDEKAYDAIVLGVAHTEFKKLTLEAYTKPIAVIYDVKGVLDTTKIDSRL